MKNARRVLICGSRDFTDRAKIVSIVSNLSPGTVIIGGGARGADTIAYEVATAQGLQVFEYRAEWSRYGKGAGPIRNKRMLDEGKPDLVFAFYSDKVKSRGTKNMVEQAIKAGVPVIEYCEED